MLQNVFWFRAFLPFVLYTVLKLLIDYLEII